MEKRKKITAIIGWQLIGRLFVEGISFVAAPIFTRLLSPADYGQTSTFTTWVSLLQLIVGLQTSGSLAQARIRYGEKNFEQYASSILGISILSYIILLPTGVIFRRQIGNILGFKGFLIPVILTQAFCNFIIDFFSTKLEQQYRTEKKTIISIIFALSGVLLSYIFITHMESEKYAGRIIGNFIPSLVITVIEIVILYGRGKRVYDRKYWTYCLGLTLPLIFHGLSGVILSQSDRIMLKEIAGEEETGIYSVTYTLALVVAVIKTAFNQSWLPFYYDYKKQKEIKKLKEGEKIYCMIFTIVIMGFILCSPDIFRIIAPSNYWGGIVITPLVAMAYYVDFLYSFPGNHEFYNEKTNLIMWGTVFAAVINIALNLCLIPKMHGLGAAIATLLSMICMLLFHEYNARRRIGNFEFDFRLYIFGFLACMISVIIFYLFLDSWIIRWSCSAGLAVTLVLYINKNKEFLRNF